VCFTVWEPSVFQDKVFQIGEQFMVQPNSSFNDATCAQRSVPPRLSFQAHSAPLDASFDGTNSNLYVTFHGSWNRPTPTGFKVVVVKFQRGPDGKLGPVALANSGNGYTDVFWNTDSSKCSRYILSPLQGSVANQIRRHKLLQASRNYARFWWPHVRHK
jgi:hypothetical protein